MKFFCSYCNSEEEGKRTRGGIECQRCQCLHEDRTPAGCHVPEGTKPQEVGGDHYQQGLQVTPWELQRTMKSSGNAFVDSRRSDAIKYGWRMKGDNARLLEDLKKARHCLGEAIGELEKELSKPKS